MRRKGSTKRGRVKKERSREEGRKGEREVDDDRLIEKGGSGEEKPRSQQGAGG